MTEANNTSADYLSASGRVRRYPRKDIDLCLLTNFLSPAECDRLITLIDERRHPSTIADPNGDDYFRTSETCDLDHSDEFVAGIDARICELADIDPQFGEPLQGQRYAVGQEFKPALGFFGPAWSGLQSILFGIGATHMYIHDLSQRTGGGWSDPFSAVQKELYA